MAEPRIPYETLGDERTLRDRLASDRTALANERTLLAYARTALGLLATGGAFLHFVDSLWSTVAGWSLVAVAPLVLGVGVHRFTRIRRRLAAI